MINKLIVPAYKFKEMEDNISQISLSEKSKATSLIPFQNIEYLITGGVGTGTGIGWAKIWACRVIDLKLYKGNIEPLPQAAHGIAVNEGKRSRGYEGLIVTYKNRTLVCCEGYEFFPEAQTQLSISF